MKSNPVKAKLAAKEPTYGTWLTMADLYGARVLSRMGFDWLTVDLEHSAIDWSKAATIFAVIADAGCVPLARVPEGTHHYIKRVLDAGAAGIVVPMVETQEQAQVAISAAKYPPVGNRSIGGGMGNLNFSATSGDYYLQANDEILVILQTESPLGVENAESIYSQSGCDAIFVGPNDLRFRMRHDDGTFPTPEEHEAMSQRVIQAGRDAGTPTGIHTLNATDAKRRAEQGMQFIAVGSDLNFLATMAEQTLREICPDQASGDVARY